MHQLLIRTLSSPLALNKPLLTSVSIEHEPTDTEACALLIAPPMSTLQPIARFRGMGNSKCSFDRIRKARDGPVEKHQRFGYLSSAYQLIRTWGNDRPIQISIQKGVFTNGQSRMHHSEPQLDFSFDSRHNRGFSLTLKTPSTLLGSNKPSKTKEVGTLPVEPPKLTRRKERGECCGG